MAIRILHVVEALGVGGGVENGIANLIAHMDQSRFEHVLCAIFRMGPLVNRYTSDRVRMVCLEQRQHRLSIQAAALTRLIRREKPDIVHSRNWGALEAVIAGRCAGSCVVVHSEHGVEMNPAAEPRRRRWFRRVAFSLADEVFSVSYQLRDMLADRTGFPLRKIGVIHNGVDTGRFKPDGVTRRGLRAELGVMENEFCIGCVGRLDKIKDYPTMLRAAEILNETCRPWRVFIVGSGPERPALEQLVSARTALAGKVLFLGASDRVPEFLNAMDVYALPSICEGISNSLLEAMAAGVPVVATATGGNPEVVEDGKSGLLFSVGDARQLAEQLMGLRSNPERRDGLACQARRRVREQFSLDAMVGNYERMYERLAIKRFCKGGRLTESQPAAREKQERLV